MIAVTVVWQKAECVSSLCVITTAINAFKNQKRSVERAWFLKIRLGFFDLQEPKIVSGKCVGFENKGGGFAKYALNHSQKNYNKLRPLCNDSSELIIVAE